MKSNIWLRLYIFFVLFFIFCELMGIIVFNVMTIKTIHSTVDIVTKKTLQMQIMFYKSALIESIFVICFIFLPFCFAALIIFSIINNMHLGIIFFNLPPLSAPISYILVMVLIKPYRMFFVTICKKIKSGRIKDSSSSEQRVQIIVHRNSVY
uniref:G-protein coupled receptors family 1 profile domain-containing protein n=1 Tax=Acrobeloides nanus TaxID=290746 RepID=A0A914EFA4_9BILA